MNKLKLFGICIGVLIALTLVNAITLDQLLSSYDNSYDDGGFTADLSSFKTVWASNLVPNKEAGRNTFNFSIGGTDATSLYTAVATLNVEGNPIKDDVVLTQNLTTSGIASFSFDGNQYPCDIFWTSSTTRATFDVELKIYKNGNLRYQKTFKHGAVCSTQPVYFDYTLSKALKVVDTGDADSLYDYLNISLYFFFMENKAHKVGLYVWDNKSSTIYIEKTITTTGINQNFLVPFIINSTLLKDFELNNEKVLLKSVSVDGHIMPYGVWVDEYNKLSSTKYYSSDFERNDILITNVSFDKAMSGSKIKELGVKVNTINSVGVYNIELSLENQFGETIKTINKTTSFAGNTETLWINGTEMYNSKISGPYRVGFLRITKLGNDVAYRLDSATSANIEYLNFTSPPMPDLKINATGDLNDINVTVNNLGNGDAAGVTISLYDENSNRVKEIMVGSINASTTYFHSFNDVNLTHAFVFVDFNNLIEETNESNNIAEFILQGAIIQPARIISKQPINSVTMTDSQSKQFNVTVNGTLPINYKWYINNGSLFRLISTSNNFVFTPGYYDEGIRILKINVSNSNGSDEESWNVNVTPNKIAVYAYVYNKNLHLLGNKTAINSDISFDGIVKTATSTPAKINLSVDTIHNLTYYSTGFKNFTTKFHFDRRLFTCKENQNCVLTNTNCVWDSTNNDNWACTVTTGANTDYFRMYTGPKRIKINAYLAVNST